MEEPEPSKIDDLADTILKERPNDPHLAIAAAVALQTEKAEFIELASIEVHSLGSSVGAVPMCLQLRMIIHGITFNPPAQLLSNGDYSSAVEAFKGIKLSASFVMKKAAEDSPTCGVVHDTIVSTICKSTGINPKTLLTLPRNRPKKPLRVGVAALHVPNTKIRIYISSNDLASLPRLAEPTKPTRKGDMPPLPLKTAEISDLVQVVTEMRDEMPEGYVLLYSQDPGNPIDLSGIERIVILDPLVNANGLSALQVCNALDSGVSLIASSGVSVYEKGQYAPLSKMFLEAAYSSGGTVVLSDWTDPEDIKFDETQKLIFPEGLKHILKSVNDVTEVQLRHFQAKLTDISYPLAYDGVHISAVFEMISRGGFLVKGLLLAILAQPLAEGTGFVFQTTILSMFRFDYNRIADYFGN